MVLSSFGRVMRLTERAARRLPTPTPQIVELDVTNQDDLDALAGRRRRASSTASCTPSRSRPSRASAAGSSTRPGRTSPVALQVSAYSLKALAVAALPLMGEGGSIVGLDFDNDDAAWPVYDWMGVVEGGVRVGRAVPRPRPRAARASG